MAKDYIETMHGIDTYAAEPKPLMLETPFGFGRMSHAAEAPQPPA